MHELLVLFVKGSCSAAQNMICSLSAIRSYRAYGVESLIRESSYRLMNMIKHLPLTLNRDLIKYNEYIFDSRCQSYKDSKCVIAAIINKNN